MAKRVFLVIIALLLCFSIVACNEQGSNGNNDQTETKKEETVKETTVEVDEVDYDPYGAYAETITLTYGKAIDATEKMAEGESQEENQYTRHIKDVLNIDAVTYWQVASGADSDQRIGLAIASDDLPDAMTVNSTQLYQMVRAGQVADMTDVYNNYASPEVKYKMDTSNGRGIESVTFDGKMMAIPSLNTPADGYHLMWIRKDWLDKLGLEPPKTIEDVEAVARAFIEQDPDGDGEDDTIGLVGPQSGGKINANFLQPTNNSFGFDPIFAAFKAFPGFWLEDEAGNAVYGSILPETREALAKLADMYKNGLIDPEMGVKTDSAEAITAGNAGMFSGLWWTGYWPLPDAWKIDKNANWKSYPIYADDGNSYFHMGTPANSFCVVNKNYEHPEAVMKVINENARYESEYDFNLSSTTNMVLRLPMVAYDAKAHGFEVLNKYLAGEVEITDYDEEHFKIYHLLEGDLKSAKELKLQPYDNLDIQYWDTTHENFRRIYSILVGAKPIYDEATNKKEVFSLIYSQTDSMSSKWSNLAKIEEETFMKIIMGVLPIEAFDQFVEDWKSQGGSQITAEVQEASQR